MLPHTLPSKLSTFYHYMLYLENIAYYNNDINHSHTVKRFFTDIDDLTLNKNLKYPIMLAIPFSGRHANERDALFYSFGFDVYILTGTNKSTTQPQSLEIISNNNIICRQIVKLIEEDSAPATSANIRWFNPADSDGEAIDEPMFSDNMIGWMVKLVLGNQENMTVDNSKWKHRA